MKSIKLFDGLHSLSKSYWADSIRTTAGVTAPSAGFFRRLFLAVLTAGLSLGTALGQLAQPAVSSANATITFGGSFTPAYSGGAGTGNWQFCVVNYTNWAPAPGGQAGTQLPNGTWVAAWTPTAVGTYQFYIGKCGDSSYANSSFVGPYTLTVNKAPMQPPTPVNSSYTIYMGQSWSALSNVSSASIASNGSGSLIWCVSGQTNFNTSSWTPPAAGTYYFYLGQQADGNHNGNNTDATYGAIEVNSTGYALTVQKLNQGSVVVSATANGASLAISGGTADINAGTTVTFSASGGNGSGGYVWGGLASGTGTSASVAFPSAGTFQVSVYRAGDATYNASSSTSVTVTVHAVYSLTVNSGTGSGSYRVGDTPAVAANTAPYNQVFYQWSQSGPGTLGSNWWSTNFTMASGAATLTAQYRATVFNWGSTPTSVAAGTPYTVSIGVDTGGDPTVTLYKNGAYLAGGFFGCQATTSDAYNASQPTVNYQANYGDSMIPSSGSSTMGVNITPPPPPNSPTGLNASSLTDSSFTLNWSASTDSSATVAGYEVSRNGVSLGVTSSTSMVVNGLAPNTNYQMTVRAYDQYSDWSAWSSPLSVITNQDSTPPSVPTGVSIGGSSATTLTIQWNPSSDNVGVTDYEVQCNGVSEGTVSVSPMTITGLNPTSTYQISVRASDARSNWSGWSPSIQVSTQADTTAPSVPTGLSSSNIAAGSCTLNWSASTDNVGVTGYEVSCNGISQGVTSGTSMAISGLTPVTTYQLAVRARDAAGNWSAYSGALSVTTTADTTPPNSPAGLAASNVTYTSFTLAWSQPYDNVGVTSYQVLQNGVLVGTTGGTSLTISGLNPAVTYQMTVRAGDAAGNWSGASSALPVTTLTDTTPPSTPTGLAASGITSSSFTLTWTASADNVGVTAYEVSQNGATLGTTSNPSMTVIVLNPSTTYQMAVRARDASANWSAWSSVLAVTTLAPQPSAPTFTWQPNNQSVAYGSSAVFSVTVSGYPAPTYQWQRMHLGGAFVPVTDNGTFSGSTTATLTITGVTADMDLDQYRCIVTNASGTATSLAARLNDADGDGVSDAVEVMLGLNPNNPSDATVHWFQYDSNGQLLQDSGGNYTIDAEGNINKTAQ